MVEAVDIFALTREQQDTATLLEQLLGRNIADRYVDFSRLAAGATYLRVSRPVAAHALRELDSMLRSAMEVPMDAKTISAALDPKKLDAAAAALRLVGLEDAQVQCALGALTPRLSHANQIRTIAKRLGFAEDSDVEKAWVALSNMSGRAHERSFHRTLAVDDDFRAKFQQPFDFVIRNVANALQAKYSALMLRVEALAAMPNAGRAVKLFEREIPGAPPLQWHFFRKIDSPRWLRPLIDHGLIGEPPSEYADNGVSARFRQWPVGHYLLRMAKSEDTSTRRLVADAIRAVASAKLPDVRHRGFEIIAALPTLEAVALIDIVVGWLSPDSRTTFLETPMRLLQMLAAANQTSAAFRITSAIFQIVDQDGRLETLHFNGMYEHYLTNAVPVLANLDGMAAVQQFSNLLVQVATIKRRFNPETTIDTTYHTPGRIADNQMAKYDVYYALIIAVRDAAFIVVQNTPAQTNNVVSSLIGYHLRIFDRIAFHILSKHPSAAAELATKLLTNPKYIGEAWCEHEYAELALAWFPSLSKADQERIFSTIDALPDEHRTTWFQRLEEHQKTAPTAEEELAFNASIIRAAIWKWRDVLPSFRREELDGIVSLYGTPDAWREQLFPPESSPLTGADFISRPVSEIVSLLESWQPQEEPIKQTITALGQQLRDAVKREPARFAEQADKFCSLRPVFVRCIFEGFSATDNKHTFSWDLVLTLIESTINQLTKQVDESSFSKGDDVNWQWAAWSASNLLCDGMRKGKTGPPYKYVEQILSTITRAVCLAPRTAETRNFEESFQRHPCFAAEQTLRGAAVDLCIIFLFWASEQTGSPIADAPRMALEHFADISSLLDAELADISAGGRIPRAILGRRLTLLNYLGEDWLKSHIGALFPPEDEALRHATWSGHLLSDRGPLGQFMFQLNQSYAEEIGRIGERKGDDQAARENRLAEYLVVLYMTDQAPPVIMNMFWQSNPSEAREHAMWFLGQQLQLAHDQALSNFLARGRDYWNVRLSAAQDAEEKDFFRSELSAIGQWCGQRSIDSDWLLRQLVRMTKAGFLPGSGYRVVEWLGKISPDGPEHTIEVLAALLKNYHLESWTYAQRDSIRAILVEGLAHGNVETVQRAKEAISYLASAGESAYLDLLSTPDTGIH